MERNLSKYKKLPVIEEDFDITKYINVVAIDFSEKILNKEEEIEK